MLPWMPFVYQEQGIIIHGQPLQACKMLCFQHDGGRAKIRGLTSRELLGAARSGETLTACSALDAALVTCGVYSYCMLDLCAEIPLGIGRYRQNRTPADGEDCTLRFYYRGATDEGNLYDFILVGANGDSILEVAGYQTIRVEKVSG
jgi:hypothetical protein